MSDDLLPTGELILYTTEDGRTRIECRFADQTLWLSQSLIAELFQITVPTVNEHLRNLYDEGELDAEPTIRKFRIVRREGKREVAREIEHYNLDAILAVGYRVRSARGTQFRRWATERLTEYLVKGFVMDDERLKNPPIAGAGVPDYFDELLERIRDIRASERRIYLRVREIFALAADYDPGIPQTTTFFQTIENKLHFAATGKTAAELIAQRPDHSQPNMGLTAWRGEMVRKGDVTIAKNYLTREEITELNRVVTMWLDFAEDQARRRKQVFLKDGETKLDEFLQFNERAVLGHKGKISKDEADVRAHAECERFAARRRAPPRAAGSGGGAKPASDIGRRCEEAAQERTERDFARAVSTSPARMTFVVRRVGERLTMRATLRNGPPRFGVAAVNDDALGVRVTQVVPGSPGALAELAERKAGSVLLEAGDVITEINGEPVNSVGDFVSAIAGSPSVMYFVVENFRDGRSHYLKTTLQSPAPRFGAEVKGDPGRGVRVTRVQSNSPATRGSLAD